MGEAKGKGESKIGRDEEAQRRRKKKEEEENEEGKDRKKCE